MTEPMSSGGAHVWCMVRYLTLSLSGQHGARKGMSSQRDCARLGYFTTRRSAFPTKGTLLVLSPPLQDT
jgi:hypothetical protein